MASQTITAARTGDKTATLFRRTGAWTGSQAAAAKTIISIDATAAMAIAAYIVGWIANMTAAHSGKEPIHANR